MNKQQQLEALENALKSFSFPNDYVIDSCGSKFALARKGRVLTILSPTYKYEELNAFLLGYHRAKTNPIF